MSIFIDQLNKLTRGETASIGFTRAQASSLSRKIRLVGYVKQAGGDISGMDAVLLEVDGKAPEAGELKKMPADVPWGAWLKGGDSETMRQLRDAGCDFVVVSADTPLSLVENKETGKVLEIDISMNDGMLRTVVELPVDALIVNISDGKEESLTLRDLMVARRFGGVPKKPLIAAVPEKVTTGEMEALWQAGVVAVVTEGDGKLLREAIDKADFKTSRERDKVEPVLNRVASSDIDDDED
jgi:hypothetical protein